MDNSHGDQPDYFPKELFYRENIKGHKYLSFSYGHYSKHLYAMQEPSLYLETGDLETYRFTWLRSFHNPIVIRISNNDTFSIILKLTDGQGGYEPGNLVVNLKRTISYQDWEEFQAHLSTIDFWSMETLDDKMGFDGANWLLEGNKDHHYRLIERWSPNRSTPYYQCCDFLIQLTGLVVPDGTKY
jgi:hypothetical protein